MVDLHMHILPGLDDGSDSMEESIRMARLAAESGVNYIAASSHGNCYDYTLADYEKQFAGLQRELDRQKIPVKLYHAMEILMNRNAQQLLEEGKLLSVNHTGYLLIEFDFDENPERVYRMVAYLQRMKYNVILAHPERYSFVQADPEIAYYLAERGCVLQVNKGSILGEMGSECQRMAEMMLEDGIVQVIASDAHDSQYRTPQMDELIRYLKKRYTSMEIKMWLSENPSRSLKGYPTI